MFDYSLSGPLTGIIASLLAVTIGAQLSLTTNASTFPALPIEILRQSTLGGGLIEAVLGSDLLVVPDAALGTQAVAAMTIPLHPVAIAGYISLIVNALSLLPIGTTDGGRIAMTLFGRGGKLVVGQISMIALLLAGIAGSDLFLFYFAFCIICQSGNEIPARNEVDTVTLPRIGIVTVAYVLALLTLIPFQ
jgi:membrane-associated protease RseP (regulator of RpoE activity)